MERREPIVLNCQGQKILGVIHYPAVTQTEKLPAVLFCHGLGGHKVGKFRLYIDLAEKLASLGIVSLRFDFRGAGDSEGKLSDMTITSQVEDATLALDFLKNEPLVEARRIGLFGRSFGGLIAILCAAKASNIKSLALWAPVFSGEPWLEKWKALQNTPLVKEQKQALMKINGIYPGMPLFQQLFMLDLAAELATLHNVPLLHVCGEQDQLVTLFHAEKFQQARQHAAKSEFLRLAESDHDFSHTAERQKAMQKTVEWFKETL